MLLAHKNNYLDDSAVSIIGDAVDGDPRAYFHSLGTVNEALLGKVLARFSTEMQMMVYVFSAVNLPSEVSVLIGMINAGAEEVQWVSGLNTVVHRVRRVERQLCHECLSVPRNLGIDSLPYCERGGIGRGHGPEDRTNPGPASDL